MRSSDKQPRRQARKGQAVVELIPSIIIFTLMIAMIASASFYLFIQHAVVSAAREGARTAALSEPDEAEANATQRVQTFLQSTTGQTPTLVDVEGPTGPVGQRNYRVTVDLDLQNPIPIQQLLTALGAGAGVNLESIPVTASAEMRYEE
jgi:hypothetical protein